ncbi:MAG: leucyl/phenylalanyl-tRNA--protein transferase [Termitinemataceae bacterium]|nr:MAG: leucyl/phenylalanyl-tRNA--protein transferase [Termitinemataceae bacterium]
MIIEQQSFGRQGLTKSGIDPSFPHLNISDYFQFPDPLATNNDIVAVGGNLSPGMLVSAYKQGIFPWFNEGDPILWHSPDPRFILMPQNLHISASMKKVLKQQVFDVRFDTDFYGVISACAQVKREGQRGTWITNDMIDAYCALHKLGIAHSAESYKDNVLVGGCYGILINKIFFGESMFAKVSNASKAAFLSYAQQLFAAGILFIDCQVHTDHMESLGGIEVAKKDFIKMISRQI